MHGPRWNLSRFEASVLRLARPATSSVQCTLPAHEAKLMPKWKSGPGVGSSVAKIFDVERHLVTLVDVTIGVLGLAVKIADGMLVESI